MPERPWEGFERVDAGKDDDGRQQKRQGLRTRERIEPRADECEDERAGANRHGDAPVDAALALVEERPGDAGEDEGEERRRHRLAHPEAAERDERRDEEYAADADPADQRADAERAEKQKNERFDRLSR